VSSFLATSLESVKQAQLYSYRRPLVRQFRSGFVGSATIFTVISRYIYMGRRGVYVRYSVWRARPHTNDCLFNGVHSFSIHTQRSTLPASSPVSFLFLCCVCYVRGGVMLVGGRKLNEDAHLADEPGTIQYTVHLFLIFQLSCCEISFVMYFTEIMCGIYDLFVNSAVKYL